MRVLLVSANFRPHVGGIERFTEILADGLAERGHEVAVVCCRYGDAPLEERGGHTVRRVRATYALDERLGIPVPLPEPVALVRTLSDELRTAEVVHVQDVLYPTSLAALALARRRGVPSVVTQHVGFVPQDSRVLDVAQRGARATLGHALRLARVVTTYNPDIARAIGARVLPVGIVVEVAGEDRRALRAEFDLPAHRFVALFVGRDVPKKGLDLFLGASDPAYELVAVTDRVGAHSATSLPFMRPERLHRLLACADAFVLPSEGEGFPLSMQEALTLGVPVITTRHPGYEHYLGEDDVLFVERRPEAVREALTRLAADEDLRTRLAARSRAVAERHFTRDAFVTAYEELYAEVARAA